MLQGTASSVGKSTLVAGLCRLLARKGVRVAPFKAQNMSNNAAVCADNGEIGRAQYAQAIAAGIEPTVDMNPILLKPESDGVSQLVVRGQVHGKRSAHEYFKKSPEDLWPIVTQALDSLRERFDLVIAEGAGSPAEVNLRAKDLVNMRVALHAHADVLVVADIDRGGAFASLLGTFEWLSPEERQLVRGFILNKFRGDQALLDPAPALLEARTGVRVIGVIPYIPHLNLPEEDAASLSPVDVQAPVVEIAVVQFPHIANFDEFGPLSAEPGVHVRYVQGPADLRAPDLVILPGTKATIPDLRWLVERGLGDRIRWLAEHSTPVLGICGGYQMLGVCVRDPLRVESDQDSAPGLALLPIETHLAWEKHLVRNGGRVLRNAIGPFSALADLEVEGYEIHMGRTMAVHDDLPLLHLAGGPEGSASATLPLAGTHLHGLLESSAPRHALLHALAAQRGLSWQPRLAGLESNPYDLLADVLEERLSLGSVTDRIRA